MISRLLAIIVPVLTILVFGAYGGILGPLLPALGHDFRVSEEITGLLISATFAGSLLAVTAGGYLADRFGKALLFRITLGGLTLAYLGVALSGSFLIVAIAVFLAGALGGTLEGYCSAIIADHDPLPAHCDRNMNLLQVAFCAGSVIALLLTASLHGGQHIWRLVFLALAGVAGFFWLLSLGMRVPTAPAAAPITLAIARRVLSDPAVLLLAAAICCYVGSEMSLATWISPILERMYHARATGMLGAGVFWLSMGVGRIVIGFLCQRYSGLTVLRWLVVGGLISYLVLLLPVGSWRLWVGVGAAGATFSGIWPLLVSLGSARYPGYSGTVVAMLVSSGTVGGFIFPVLAGFALQAQTPATGIFRGLLLMAAVFALLAVALWRYARRQATAVIPTPVFADS